MGSASGAAALPTVVLADDEPMIRAAVRDLLDAYGGFAVVAEATDAAGCVEVCAAHRPSIALMDLRMPGGGPDAVRAVREASPTTRVVIFTAVGVASVKEELLAAGACAVILKGSAAAAILEVLSDALAADGGAGAVA